MKKCLLCGHVDKSGDAATCPMCGEATWSQEIAAVPAIVVEAEPVRPGKRSRR